MEVLVTHDADGAIRALAILAGGRQAAGVKPGPGQTVSTVELADVEHAGHLAKYLSHRVELGGGPPRLVKR
jgi:hypothetical protein